MKDDVKRHKEKLFPFEWADWDQLETNVMSFGNVVWLGDFGPFKKDDHSESIAVDFERGQIEEYDSVGAITRRCEFTAIAIGVDQ